MEKTWKDIFRITEDEENHFDKDHYEHIERYIKVNNIRVKAYPTTNFNRLNAEIYCTGEITLEEIKTLIRRSKKKAPGLTKINKLILEKCTDNLKNIFNACFLARFFPNSFKVAIIKFVPKKFNSLLTVY